MENLLIAVIIGVVEGVTEFLPVSSTGHMILAGHLMGFEGEVASVFEVFIQLGAILSVLFLYRDKFAAMMPRNGRKTGFRSALQWQHVAVGIIPVMGVGYLLHKAIKTYLFSPFTVIVGLVIGAILMLAAEKWAQMRRPRTCDVDEITLKQAFWVGLFQI